MRELIKPKALQKGDKVAAVSLSWGGAGQFPKVYQRGKKQFEDAFKVSVVEMPHTLDMPADLYNNPQLRLDDLMQAFADTSIKAILCTIGGEDTIRLLSYMTEKHFDVIRNNPKIFLGMSDSTANHYMCFKAGLASFYSPSLMYGYGEVGGIPDMMVRNTKKTLFEVSPIGKLEESSEYIIEHGNWAAEKQNLRRKIPSSNWLYLQGKKSAKGRLLGGCMELLSMINGSSLWPNIDDWQDAILFVETSEDMPPSPQMLYFLRTLGAQGILDRIQGILFARPGGEFFENQREEELKWLEEYKNFDEAILSVCQEYQRSDLCVVTRMDFGHTVPQNILPIGALAEIDPIAKAVTILESGVV